VALSRLSRDQSRVEAGPMNSPSMILLRLLGGASVEGPTGVVNARGTRGHRLALLALLATARRRPVTRDKLIAILWPDASDERARPQLSDALYLLRGALGEDAIIGSGDELRLNSELVTSDVERFAQLLSAGELERAIAEYAGPLLDGFHLNDAAEFERWLDGERARLAACFADALGTVAAAHEREQRWAESLPYLRQLATHDPYASRTALRLMRALNAVGNRAGALQHARVHIALLRDEFVTEPDAEVVALVDQLTAEPGAAETAIAVTMSAATTCAATTCAATTCAATTCAATTGAVTTSAATISAATTVAETASFESLNASPGAVELRMAAAPVAVEARNIETVVSPAGVSAQPWSRRRSILLGVGMATLAAVIFVARTGDGNARDATIALARPSALAPQRSIAVLPFDDLGAAQDEAWFSDGLTEEIIGLLGRVDGLRVAARLSSFALRNRRLDARSMGDTLRVATLLEGSVRRDGDQMRVTARLVDVATGYQLWSRSYDRKVSDAIALQHEIASAIVGALQLRLSPSQVAGFARAPDDPEVHDLYLRAAHARNKLTREEMLKAVDYFDRAIRLDSSYAPAYAGKATTLGPMIWYGHMPRAQGVAMLRAAAARAVALDPSLPEAHVARGMLAFFFDWNWSEGEEAFRRAIELNPNEAIAHHFLANLLRSTRRFDEAIAERMRSIELDPLSVRTTMQLGTDYFLAGRTALAAAQFRRAAELEPRSPALLGQGPTVSLGLGHVYEHDGQFDAALTEYLKLDSLNDVAPAELVALRQVFAKSGMRGYWRRRGETLERSEPPADLIHLAWVWSRVGETGKVVQLLERAYRARNPGMVFLGVHPDFAAARKDPRVQGLLARMGLQAVER
jgi:TolB-like protein/DNA-binding SARP family transcriptional activator